MSRASYASTLARLLEPLGFVRDRNEWRRNHDGHLDSVDLQVSSYGGVTSNISTKDLTSEQILLEAVPPDSPGLMYAVTYRIGYLMDRTDRWWCRDPNGPRELTEAVRIHALPFFERMHPLEEQARALGRGYSHKWNDPTRTFYLAIALYRMGERKEACEILAEKIPRRTTPAWVAQIDGLRRRLGCDGAQPSPTV